MLPRDDRWDELIHCAFPLQSRLTANKWKAFRDSSESLFTSGALRSCELNKPKVKRIHDVGELFIFYRAFYLFFFLKGRRRSGRNSFTTPIPILLPMVIPKLTAASPAEC